MRMHAFTLGLLLFMANISPAMAGWDPDSFGVPPNSAWPQVKSHLIIDSFGQPWPDSLSLGDSGFFLIGIGGFGVNDTLNIEASGKCIFIYHWSESPTSSVVWKRYEFMVPHKIVDEIGNMLQTKGCSGIQRIYSNEDVNDGCEAELSWSNGKVQKTVFMSNLFPDQFRAIVAWLRETILIPRQSHFGEGKTLDMKEVGSCNWKFLDGSPRAYSQSD